MLVEIKNKMIIVLDSHTQRPLNSPMTKVGQTRCVMYSAFVVGKGVSEA